MTENTPIHDRIAEGLPEVVVPDPEGAPAVPERVRTVAYIVALVVGGLTLGLNAALQGLGAAGVVTPESALAVGAIGGAVGSAVSTIAGGFGVAYRPTK